MLLNFQKIDAYLTLSDKYNRLKNIYSKGGTYIILNNISVFGPFEKRVPYYDISKDEYICIYNKDVKKVIDWIKINIILNLGNTDITTLDVLLRIATGMINKLNIDHNSKILFQHNMIENIHREYYKIVTEELPF